MNRYCAQHVDTYTDKQPTQKAKQRPKPETQVDSRGEQVDSRGETPVIPDRPVSTHTIQSTERPIIQFIHKLNRIMKEKEKAPPKKQNKRPKLVIKLRNVHVVAQQGDSGLSDVPSDYCLSD
jgi:hypothetical protein